MRDYHRAVEEYIKSQDELEFGLGDTLDVKTSIALVVITFLATQSADFLRHNPPLPGLWHAMQLTSAGLLAIAGVLAVIELSPRGYTTRTAPSEFLTWVEELREYYKSEPDPESSVLEEISEKEVDKATARFEKNRSINTLKSKLVEWCFRLTLAVVLLNLATLVKLAAGR